MSNPPVPLGSASAADEISFGEVVAFIGRHLLLMGFLAILFAGAVGVYVFSQPRKYLAYGSVFVTQNSSLGMSAMLPAAAQELLRGSTGGGQGEYIQNLLKSRTLQAQIYKKLKLENSESFWDRETRPKTTEVIAERFGKCTNINEKKGFIRFEVTTLDPELSKNISALMLDFLQERLIRETHNKQSFLESQLKISKQKLTDSEDAMRKFQEKTNLVVPIDIQEKGEFQTYLELSKSLAGSEAALSNLEERLNAPGDVNAMIGFKSQQAGLKAEVDLLRKMVAQREDSMKTMPQAQVQYLRLYRQIKVNEKVFEILTEQHKLAEIAEAGKDVPFKVVDKPEQPQTPQPRGTVVKALGGGVVGLLLGAILGMILDLRRSRLVSAG